MGAQAMDQKQGSSHVGRAMPRLEDARHLAGTAKFVADIRLPGMRDVAFVRSAVPHGILREIDISDVSEPDAVWTADRVASLVRPLRATLNRPGFRVAAQPIFATGRVRYVGEMIAACVGVDRARAEDIAGRVIPVIEELRPLTTTAEAMQESAPRLHEAWPNNAYSLSARTYGDFDAAVARADVSVTQSFDLARILPSPMETRGSVAHYDRGQKLLTIYISTQRPHLVRTMLAEQLVGVDESQIRVIVPDVGGGFGGKSNLYPEEIAISALALQSPYPVRWIEDRYEHFQAASHARQHQQTITAYASRDGELLAIDAEFVVDGGAYSMRTSTASIEAGMAASVLPGPYKLKNYRFRSTAVATNKTMVGPFRGVGRPAAVFAMERILDEVAAKLGMEPHEFRRRNLIAVGDHPYTTPTGLRYDSGDYAGLLDDAASAIGVDRIRCEQRVADPAGRHVIGVGFGCYVEQTAHGAEEFHQRGSPYEYGFESARVRVDPSGSVVISTGILSHGQGLETTLAQIAADELGVRPADIRVRHGDTDLCPYGMGTVASRSIVMGGGAVHGAASRLAHKVRSIASTLLGCPAEEVVLAGGQASGGGSALTLGDVARVAYHELHKLPKTIEPGLEISFNYRPPIETGAYSSGVHAAKVSVDLDTGDVKLLNFIVAEDCGRVINPLIVDGQIYGGVAQGIGQALYEELKYDANGQLQTVNFADYILPGAGEVPAIEIIHRQTLSPFTVFGMKGVGEGGAIAPPATIANAVSDALRSRGVVVTSLPIRPADLWSALEQAREASR